MSELEKTIILAVVQGMTEFLPISSSGHLVILGRFMDLKEDPLLLFASLHAGTLLSVLLVYGREIFEALKSLRILFFLFISSVPAGIVGSAIALSGLDKYLFGNSLLAGAGLLFTAIILSYLPGKEPFQEKEIADMKLSDAAWTGFAQMIAILPGVSRSGMTICAALRLGFKGGDATKYSFLMFIPIVLGASMIEFISEFNFKSKEFSGALSVLSIGFFVSAVVGYAALKIVINSAKKRKISQFKYYCFAVGVIVLALELLKLLK